MFNFARQHRTAALVTLVAVLVLAVAGVLALVVIWNDERSVTVAGDQIGCAYGSAATGHKFVRSIQPGQRASIAKTDELVLLPNGDQIYNVSTSGSRTQGAPDRVLAFTKGQTAV